MKTIKLIVIGALFFTAINQVNAQVSVGVSIGPEWGPAGYSNVSYYYLPDVEAYYDITSSQFIYRDNQGKWIHASSLPGTYANYDLYGGYKVVVNDYHGSAPYERFETDRKRYHKGYHGEAQRTIKYEKEHRHDADHGHHEKK